MVALFTFSLLILFAFCLAILADRLGIPRVTSYLFVGILFSSELLGSSLFPVPFFELSEAITEIALGIIAFLIGLEIDWDFLKKHPFPLIWGTLGQVILAVLCVSLVSYLFIPNLKLAIVLGAISATTAPAGTIAIIEEYGAKGLVTTFLLGIVILDDALGVMIFEFLTSFFSNGHYFSHILTKLLGVIMSLVLGGALGVISGIFSRFFQQEELRFPLFMALILFAVSVSNILQISPILACMSLGLLTQLVSKQQREELMLPIKHIEEFIFIVFFIFAGLHFSPKIFAENFMLIAIYIVARSLGKYIGALWGTKLGGLSTTTGRWLGFGLLPQAGIALGLAISLHHKEGFEEIALLVINITMGTTIFYAILGPILTKYSLMKAGEISSTNKTGK